MKKKMLASLLLSGMLLSVGAQVAAAENLESAKTEGEVGFVHGDKPGPTQPEEGPKDGEDLKEDEIELPSNNGIYVTHLPKFFFGDENKTSVKTAEYPAKTEMRVLKKSGTAEETNFYMPHSVQVSDVSGNEKATWTLSVVQDKPFESADASTLTNSRIRIFGNTFTNSLHDSTALSGKISGVSLDTEDATFGNHSAIPLAGGAEGELVVLKNSEPGFTNASTTSAVFKNDYLASDYNPTNSNEAAAYEGVKLNVPASDQAKAKTYKTKLTWTLTVEPGTETGE